jgi:RecJ-like exonuclease
MPDAEALHARSDELARVLTKAGREGNRIIVVTHIDADGLSSGAIAFKSLARVGASVSVRAITEMDRRVIGELKSEGFDYYLFTDLASGLVSELSSAFGNSFMIVDHHQLPEKDRNRQNVFNAWSFGFDGGTDACSSTMAYILARSLGDANKDLSHLSVVGAMGDRQDSGPGRSLVALNKLMLDDAVGAGLIRVQKDFLLYGRETRPIHETLALTYSPLIPGLSGSKDTTLAALSNAGMKLKERGRWRTLSELSNEEKQQLLDVVARHVSPSEKGSETISQLIGEVYTLEMEDSFTPLRDAREFATLLNACGRMDRVEVGLAICLGDRDSNLAEGLKIAAEYRAKINKTLQQVEAESAKVVTNGDLAFVVGDDFVEERLTGSVSSILASGGKFRDKVVMVRARSGESELKFSTRIGADFSRALNLGNVMMEAAEEVGGVGGGHSMAAGAKVPSSRGEEFMRIVQQKVSG